MQFSIKSLIIVTSLIACSLGAYKAFGPAIVEFAVPISILLGLIFAGIFAHANNIPVPFWKCFVVYATTFIWGINWHTGPPTENEMAFTAVVFATGIVLSFSAIRDGHWATKIMGLLIFLPMAYSVGFRVYHSLQNWSDIVDYWCGT